MARYADPAHTRWAGLTGSTAPVWAVTGLAGRDVRSYEHSHGPDVRFERGSARAAPRMSRKLHQVGTSLHRSSRNYRSWPRLIAGAPPTIECGPGFGQGPRTRT